MKDRASASEAAALRVLFVASECAPYAKCGGLGDVVASLPKALRRLGVDARVAIPLYDSIDRAKFGLVAEPSCLANCGQGEVNGCGVWRAAADGVDAAEEHQHPVAAQPQRQHAAAVAGRARRREARQLRHGHGGHRSAERVGRRCPAGPKHHRHVVLGDAGACGDGGGRLTGQEHAWTLSCRT